MNSVGKGLTIVLVMGAFSWHSSCAAESKTIKVSCTIPAIPGVNAPLVQQDAPRAARQTAYAQPKERLDRQDDENAEKPAENKTEETITSDEEGQTVLVKTFYSR